MTVTLTFRGAAGTVTGSHGRLQCGWHRILPSALQCLPRDLFDAPRDSCDMCRLLLASDQP